VVARHFIEIFSQFQKAAYLPTFQGGRKWQNGLLQEKFNQAFLKTAGMADASGPCLSVSINEKAGRAPKWCKPLSRAPGRCFASLIRHVLDKSTKRVHFPERQETRRVDKGAKFC